MVSSTPWLLLLISTRAAAKCYSYEGKVLAAYPCDATADISPCCGSNDFCLSNGLCLNAGGNNAFTQQGCTDEAWGAPCRKYCTGNVGKLGDEGDFRYLVQCSGLGSTMCCGTDSSCCNGTSILTTIPKFSTVSPPAGNPTTSRSTGTTTSNTETPTPSPSSPSSPAGSSPTSSSPTGITTPQPSSSKTPTDKSVVIGAGVGVPLGVALLGAIGLLIWQTRKRAAAEKVVRNADANAHAGQKPAPTELYSPPQPVSELDANQANRL